jgi:hypothetical protein
VFTDQLPSNGCYIAAPVGSRWNMFTESLPSNGCYIAAPFGSRGNVFTESLPSNGSVLHSIYGDFRFIMAQGVTESQSGPVHILKKGTEFRNM